MEVKEIKFELKENEDDYIITFNMENGKNIKKIFVFGEAGICLAETSDSFEIVEKEVE